MWVSARTFQAPKRGSSESEYEDACYPEDSFDGELSAWRCAVADGATESVFSREWARLLVESFGRNRFRLEEQRRLWERTVQQGPLPWYLESKITRGAHAAFVGLSLRDPPPGGAGEGTQNGCWLALAVGDSCLFHVRDDELLAAGPLSGSEEFGSSPLLLSTNPPAPDSLDNPEFSLLSGTWESNDAFFLATDALAQWLFLEEEASRPPWGFLRELDPETFAFLVPRLRDAGRLHNDDTTLLRLEVR